MFDEPLQETDFDQEGYNTWKGEVINERDNDEN